MLCALVKHFFDCKPCINVGISFHGVAMGGTQQDVIEHTLAISLPVLAGMDEVEVA